LTYIRWVRNGALAAPSVSWHSARRSYLFNCRERDAKTASDSKSLRPMRDHLEKMRDIVSGRDGTRSKKDRNLRVRDKICLIEKLGGCACICVIAEEVDY